MVCRLDIPDGRFQEFLKLIQDLRRDGLVDSYEFTNEQKSDPLDKFVGRDVAYSDTDLSNLVKEAEAEIDSGNFYTTEDIKKLLAL